MRIADSISNPPYILPNVSERKLNIPFPNNITTNIMYIPKKWKFFVIIAKAAIMSTIARHFNNILIKTPCE